jgi:hypothetical protein
MASERSIEGRRERVQKESERQRYADREEKRGIERQSERQREIE